jgi:hypothetical protein
MKVGKNVNWKEFGRKSHNFSYNPRAGLEGLRTPMMILNPDNHSPRKDLKPGPAESQDPACYEMLCKLFGARGSVVG